jgi:putative membrane protein
MSLESRFRLAFVVSVAFEIVKYGGFSLERRNGDIVVRRGLLEQSEIVISLSRVQALVFVEGVLRQPFGYGSVHMESAGHADEKGQSTVLHPFLHRSEWPAFVARVGPEHAAEPALVRPPARALPRFLLRSLAAALGASLLLSALATPALAVALLLVPAAGWLGVLRFRDTGVGSSGRVLVLRSRSLRRRTAFVLKGAIQHAEVMTSFMQRRRRLSTFRVAVASGAGGVVLGVTDLEADQARSLLSWCSPHSGEDSARGARENAG